MQVNDMLTVRHRHTRLQRRIVICCTERIIPITFSPAIQTYQYVSQYPEVLRVCQKYICVIGAMQRHVNLLTFVDIQEMSYTMSSSMPVKFLENIVWKGSAQAPILTCNLHKE